MLTFLLPVHSGYDGPTYVSRSRVDGGVLARKREGARSTEGGGRSGGGRGNCEEMGAAPQRVGSLGW